jgi:hypothetical protein
VAGRDEPKDPFTAVKGWRQDYWMLRLLDERGLDLTGGGGPCDWNVGETKYRSQLRSFDGFARRLASCGWVIVHRNLLPGKPLAAVPVGQVDPGNDVELDRLGGLVGEALGLSPSLARLIFEHSKTDTEPHPASEAGQPKARSAQTPDYGRYLALDPAVLRVLNSAISDSSPDRDELAALAEAAKAAATAA